MKKFLRNLFDGILTVIALPFVFILLFFVVLYTPIDYLRYRLSPYYKRFSERYTWLCGSSTFINIYNIIEKYHLPIEYFRNKMVPVTGYGFFKYQKYLILADYNITYDDKLDDWFVNFGDDEPSTLINAVSADFEAFCQLFEEKVEKIIVLVDEEIYNDIVKYDFSDIVFLKVENEKYLSAFKKLLEENL